MALSVQIDRSFYLLRAPCLLSEFYWWRWCWRSSCLDFFRHLWAIYVCILMKPKHVCWLWVSSGSIQTYQSEPHSQSSAPESVLTGPNTGPCPLLSTRLQCFCPIWRKNSSRGDQTVTLSLFRMLCILYWSYCILYFTLTKKLTLGQSLWIKFEID